MSSWRDAHMAGYRRSGYGTACYVNWRVWSFGLSVDLEDLSAGVFLGPVELWVGVGWEEV